VFLFICLILFLPIRTRPKEPPHPGDRELHPLSSVETPQRPSHLRGPGGKRDSGFSCFSIASSPPVHDHRASDGKGASTENMFFPGKGPRRAERTREKRPAGRPGVGPVWQVPEKKKSQSPPPPPPLRSDSFAKVFPYSDGPGAPAQTHGPARPTGSHLRPQQEARRGFAPLLPNMAADHNHTQLHPNKLISLSSNDVRQSARAPPPAHQRQRSDDGPSCTGSAPPAKIQSVGSYYRSLQELRTNIFGRRHARPSTASVAGSANPKQENGGRGGYHGPAGERSVRTAELQVRLGRAEEPQAGFPSSSRTKDRLPPSQLPHGGPSSQGPGPHHDHRASDLSVRGGAAKRPDGHVATLQRSDRTVGPSWHQDPWVPQEDHRISPLRTPLLHSLAQERRSLAAGATQDAAGGKSHRRSDRYATGLRSEVREKRAQLQKSRSAATLTCNAVEEEEEEEEWRSTRTAVSSGASFSNTYKDHLKEAQARVLQATSFQRRDLEPLGPEAVRPSGGRVRGRKRLPAAQRTHSFSEPDKMNTVGVEGEPHAGAFGERRKFFEAKPAFSRPLLKSGPPGTSHAELGEKVNPKEEEALPSAEEQLRLGTFAEYQATWNRQQRSPEEQGRGHSAENILEACVEEKAGSSPSADLDTQVSPEGRSRTWRRKLTFDVIQRKSFISCFTVSLAEPSSPLEKTSQVR